jgi:hypothetical protein
MTTTSPGERRGTSTSRIHTRNASAFTVASIVTVASGPPRRTAASIVQVFQCPCGTGSIARSPTSPQPYRRVMFVRVPLSSTNTRFSGGPPANVPCQASRAAFTSGRSCSTARSDFF